MTSFRVRSRWVPELGTGSLALVVYCIPLVLDRALIYESSDLRGFVINMLRSRDSGQFILGATGDFSRSLGISNYPISLALDLPWLLATSVSSALSQVAFGATTCISIYVAVNVLGALAGVDVVIRRTAAFLLPLLMFLPGPVEWNGIARYAASFGWIVALMTCAVAMLFGMPRMSQWVARVGLFVIGCAVFLGNVTYLPFSVPTIGAAILYGCWSRRRTELLPFLGRSAALVAPVILAIPMFLGTYLFGVWAVPDVAVSENVDRTTSWSDLRPMLLLFPDLGNSPVIPGGIADSLIQVVALVILVISIRFAWTTNRLRLARIGLYTLVLQTGYSILYFVAARYFDREAGLSPKYTEILAYPIWILLICNLVLAPRVLRGAKIMKMASSIPIVIMLLWCAQWTVRNFNDSAPSQYPIRVSSTSLRLQELVREDHSRGSFSRTILIQERFSPERDLEGHRIRRANNFTETFYMELSYLKIPVLNAYSHMISPRAFAETNDLFGDGRPSWRQYSLYDRANVAAMPPLGIRYVLSEVPLDDPGLELLSAENYLVFGLDPSPKPAFLYRVALPDPISNTIIDYSLTGKGLRIEAAPTRPTSVIVPVEYSRCLTLRDLQPDSNVTMKRSLDGLVELRFDGIGAVELRYQNSLFQIRNCRIRDYLDFRTERTP